MEAALRRRALAALRRGIQAGDALQDICAALGIDRARLRDWQRHHDARVAKGTRASALGRKPRECTEHTWTAMRHHLALFGPGLGARELRLEFPDASYWDCESAAWMFRRELRWFFNRCTMTACTWNVPGSVWAADVWQPDQPVEGCYPYILDVRDLATGYMIESMPLKHCTAALVTGTLERLYRIHGAPLVLKTDNGVEFTQGHSSDMHERWGVTQLLSPPYVPSYNGSCEAGHGGMRYRAEMLSRRDGRPGDWTLEHLEGARDWGNDTQANPGGPTRRERFASRRRIDDAQRDQFRVVVALEWHTRWQDLSIAAKRQARTIRCMSVHDTVSRAAISAALRGLDYLNTRNVRFRKDIPFEKTSNNSP